MKRKILSLIIRTVVSISLIGWLLFSLGEENLREFPAYLANASYSFLILAVVVFFIAVTICGLRWGKLLKVQGIKLSFGAVFNLTFIGFFFSNFLPGVVGGDAVKFYYLLKNAFKKSASLASILLDRLLGIFALVIISFFFLLFKGRLAEMRDIIPIVFGLFALMVLAIVLFFNIKERAFARIFLKIKWMNIGENLKKFYDALICYRQNKGALTFGLILSLIIQSSMVVISYLVGLSFHINIPFLYFFIFVPIISLVMSIPISISGIGVREGAFVLFFGAVENVTKMDAFALGVGFYIVTLVTSLVGFLIYLIKGREIGGRNIAQN